jgi:hypothetical protein
MFFLFYEGDEKKHFFVSLYKDFIERIGRCNRYNEIKTFHFKFLTYFRNWTDIFQIKKISLASF